MRRFGMLVVLLAALLWMMIGVAGAQEALAPTSATVVGSLAVALGCASDADPACEAAALTFDEEDQLWSGVFSPR